MAGTNTNDVELWGRFELALEGIADGNPFLDEELVRRCWEGAVNGGYVGHGETYVHPHDILWWAKGGVLHGESATRLAFLQRILTDGPAG